MLFDDEIDEIGEEVNVDKIEYDIVSNVIPSVNNLVNLLEEMLNL